MSTIEQQAEVLDLSGQMIALSSNLRTTVQADILLDEIDNMNMSILNENINALPNLKRLARIAVMMVKLSLYETENQEDILTPAAQLIEASTHPDLLN